MSEKPVRGKNDYHCSEGNEKMQGSKDIGDLNSYAKNLVSMCTAGIGNSRKPAAVVVNAENANGYGVVVNLGRKGIPVVSVDCNSKSVVFLSRYTQKALCHDPDQSEDAFIDFLVNLGKSIQPKPVLFVTGDLRLLVVLRHREKLELYYHMPSPSLEIASKLVDKIQFYRALESLGIPHATTYIPDDLSEVIGISQTLDYPYIIKPVQSSVFARVFQNKCLRAGSARELVSLYQKGTAVEDQLIIQKELAGSERYLVYMYFNRDGKPVAVCCYKKQRITPIDYGNACACETMWDQEVVDLALRFLQEIGYSGLAEAEIQRDANDGRLKLVEINARSTTQTRLAARCGMNMEYMAYREALDLDVPEMPPAKLGVKWIEILRDIRSIFGTEGYLTTGKMTVMQWLRSLRGEREYAFLTWDDPIPFLVLLLRFGRTYGLKMKNFMVFGKFFQSLISKKLMS